MTPLSITSVAPLGKIYYHNLAHLANLGTYWLIGRTAFADNPGGYDFAIISFRQVVNKFYEEEQ